VAEHYCQFVVKWPRNQAEADQMESCGKLAGMKRDTVWLCAEHFDEVEKGLKLWASISVNSQ
jgi:hypothetical protein